MNLVAWIRVRKYDWTALSVCCVDTWPVVIYFRKSILSSRFSCYTTSLGRSVSNTGDSLFVLGTKIFLWFLAGIATILLLAAALDFFLPSEQNPATWIFMFTMVPVIVLEELMGLSEGFMEVGSAEIAGFVVFYFGLSLLIAMVWILFRRHSRKWRTSFFAGPGQCPENP